MPYHPSLASSSVHHSSHQWTAVFLLNTMSPKLLLVLKNDIKQYSILQYKS